MEYEILHVFPFDSVRKRMSIVVRNPNTNQIIVYCKGADSAILSQIKQTGNDIFICYTKCGMHGDINKKKYFFSHLDFRQTEEVNRSQIQIDNYAREGLRTLVMAKRILSENEYRDWLNKFREAELSVDRRDELLSNSYCMLEDYMELVGSTGIEDRLQDRVPETIESLRKAGIVIWVLTGDKQETAINISYSCKLFTPDMDIIKLNARSKDSAENTIQFYLKEIERLKKSSKIVGNDLHQQSEQYNSTERRGSDFCPPLVNKERALVVDGRTLT